MSSSKIATRRLIEHECQFLHSKGLLLTIDFQDFPFPGKKCFLHIKRRCWHIRKTGQIVSKDWTLVQ